MLNRLAEIVGVEGNNPAKILVHVGTGLTVANVTPAVLGGISSAVSLGAAAGLAAMVNRDQGLGGMR